MIALGASTGTVAAAPAAGVKARVFVVAAVVVGGACVGGGCERAPELASVEGGAGGTSMVLLLMGCVGVWFALL